MIIERVERHKPNWGPWDYATISQQPLFSRERWGKTVQWNVLKDQAEKIGQVVDLLAKIPYPSGLFTTYIELIRANIEIFDDMFFYLVGSYLTDGIANNHRQVHGRDETWHRLCFWNIDCLDTMGDISGKIYHVYQKFLVYMNNPDLEELRHKVNDSVDHSTGFSEFPDGVPPMINCDDISAYEHAYSFYETDVNRESLVKDLDYILWRFQDIPYDLSMLANNLVGNFTFLLGEFRQCEYAQKVLKAWEREMDKPQERLYAQLEKNPDFAPWVNAYLYSSDKDKIIDAVYPGDKKQDNTKNWIKILSLAVVLEEYELRQKEQNPPADQPKRKRGRPRATPIRAILNEPVDERYNKLCQELNGQKGKQAALIITCADDAGWFKEKPKFNQLKVLGVVGASSGYNRQKKDFFSSEEIERVKKLLGIVSQ